MPKHSDSLREKLIGLGQGSMRKSYYPELKERLQQLELFRTLLESAVDGVLLLDAETMMVLDANGAACRFAGLPWEALTDKPLACAFPALAGWMPFATAGEGDASGIPPDRDFHRNPGTPAGMPPGAQPQAGPETGPNTKPGTGTNAHPAEDGEERRMILQTAHGRDTWLELALKRHDIGGVRYVSCIARDVSRRMHAEQELRESEHKYRTLFEAANDAIFLIHDGVVREANRRACELFGRTVEELTAMSPSDLSPQQQWRSRSSTEVAGAYMAMALAGTPQCFEWTHVRADGNHFETEISLSRFTLRGGQWLIAIIRDVTEQKKLREIMVQTEKMMSIGGIAAGMAHEINNPLSAIAQSVQNVQRRLAPDIAANDRCAREVGVELAVMQRYFEARGLSRLLANIRDACARAAGIVRNMLDFARRSDAEHVECDMAELMDKAVDLAENDYDLKKRHDFRKIRIVRDYAPDVPPVSCVRTEIEQVLFNLLKNASQAIAQKNYPAGVTPCITLRIAGQRGAPGPRPGAGAGCHVRLDVEDNGPGMDEATRVRVFEPFFTSKPPGEGTGLGLSVSYYIVNRNHDGQIFAESQPGHWCRFTVLLPASVPCAEGRGPEPAA